MNRHLGSAFIAIPMILAASCSTDSASPNEATDDTDRTTSQITAHADRPVYTSIEELADSADTVLIGTVGEIQETSNEGGGTVMAYTSIDVREWLRKPDRLNDEDGAVIVSVPDVTSQSEDELAAFHLEQGQIVAIFGSYISPDDAPIAIPESGLISPLSLEGILDIEEDTATARSSLLLAKTEAEASEIEDEMEPSLAPDGSEITTSDARAAQQMSISFDLESVRVLVVG